MIKRILGVIFLGFIYFSFAQGQSEPLTASQREVIHEIEDTLGVLAFAIVNDSFPENRFAAVRKFIPTLVKALKVPNSFQYDFERLSTVSIQYPQDSSFRIFTWQLYVDVNEYRYFGAIQMNSDSLELFPLRDRSFELQGNLEQLELTPDQWYGAIYYNTVTVNTPQQKYYLLLGYDRFELFKKRKLVEVLYFDEHGKPRMGAPILPFYEGEMKKRLVLEYTAEASIRLNYDPALDLIIFDHLIPMEGNYGEGMVNVSDGSYEGFKITSTGLEFVPKVFNVTLERPLNPYPILGKEREKKKDLFGNQKKD